MTKEIKEYIWGTETWLDYDPACPTLIKLLETEAALSVQVHPEKNESWYITSCKEGAKIALGWKKDMSKDEVANAIEETRLEEYLNFIEVKAGEKYDIPHGTVHALGAGISCVEIQDNKLVTYRLYDYGRPRELHVQQALDVLLLNKY